MRTKVDKEVKCFPWERRFVRYVGGTRRYVPKPRKLYCVDYFHTTIYFAEFSSSWWLIVLGPWEDFVMKIGKDVGEESFDVVHSCLELFVEKVMRSFWGRDEMKDADKVWHVICDLVKGVGESVPKVLLDVLDFEAMVRW